MLNSPLNAIADTAGNIFSSSTFEVPQFQRQYAWGKAELDDFWSDLRSNLDDRTPYFLGLIILTEDGGRNKIVDGQQRLLTLSLLAACIYHTAVRIDRKSLADRVSSSFLYSVDYQTDESIPRILLADPESSSTFRDLLDLRGSHDSRYRRHRRTASGRTSSDRLKFAYNFLAERLDEDIEENAFQRLGAWAEFITKLLYFAVFMHDDPATAYQVFEVINTRGKDLTTADLLKNFVLSRAEPDEVNSINYRWEGISVNFPTEGANNFVQYIRHVITSYYGHVLPRELYKFLIGRQLDNSRMPPSADELLSLLEDNLESYLQMVDPSLSGPASDKQLRVFSAFNQLNVIALRPIMLAAQAANEPDDVAEFLLRLAVRRMVVGNLGTGNVERRFGDAAEQLRRTGDAEGLYRQLSDLNPKKDEFVERVKVRALNKGLLSFLRRSAFQNDSVPAPAGTLQWIWQPSDGSWIDLEPSLDTTWAFTIGNSVLVDQKDRPVVSDWNFWKGEILGHVLSAPERDLLSSYAKWGEEAADHLAEFVAKDLVSVWY